MTKLMPDRRIDFGFGDQVAPRIGFVWDPTNTGRSKVFAQYGRFYQSVPLNINVHAFGNEQHDLGFYSYPGDGGLPDPSDPGSLFFSTSRRSEDTALDPNLRPHRH